MRPKESDSYLRFAGADHELQTIDETYLRRYPDSGLPVIFRNLGSAGREAYWARTGRSGEIRDLGVRGRIWALTLLLARYGHVYPRVSAAAAAISRWAKDAEKEAKTGAPSGLSQSLADLTSRMEQLDRTEPTVRDGLAALMSFDRKERFPPTESADNWLRLVVEAAAAKLLPSDAEPQYEEFKACATAGAAAPSDIYRALYAIVERVCGEPRDKPDDFTRRAYDDDASIGREWKAGLTEIDAALEFRLICQSSHRTYEEPDANDRSDDDIKRLLGALTENKRRFFVVSGEPSLGKKSKVKGALRILASETDQLGLLIRSPTGVATHFLPIFAASGRTLNYRNLVDRVARFLERYAIKANRSVEPHRPAYHFDEAVENIFARYKGLPAVFVFTDVEAFESDQTRQAIKDTGIRRLIEAILAADPQNRIIITTDQTVDHKRPRYLARPRSAEEIQIAAPNVSDLKNCVHPKAYAQLPSEHLASLETIRGDDLVALSALLSLRYHGSGKGAPLSRSEWSDISTFLNKDRNERDDERPQIYRLLVDAIDPWNLLHPLALIAASYDGVRDGSLGKLLTEWRAEDRSVTAGRNLDRLLRSFEKLKEIAGKRFLRRARICRFDKDEYGPEEVAADTDQVWDMDPLVAFYFLQALSETRPELVAAAHRLIARIARRRAQTKKVMMRAPLGSRVTEDASRDIQSFTSLVTSIQFDPEACYSLAGPPLGCAEEEIYSVDPKRFNPARALRFATYNLLKEDIDLDHRMTMVFDEDALRLDLYLLLFLQSGREHPTRFERRSLPTELPGHLQSNVFREEEVVDLMNTVALAAFHAHRFDVVEDISRLAADYIVGRGETLPAKLARLWCSQIDSHILQGSPPGGGGHAATYEALQALKDRYFPGIDGNVETLLEAGRPAETVRGFMRLLAREAELHGLLDETGERARATYDKLLRLEAGLAEAQRRHDPAVLSGRAARRFIRWLLSDANLEAEPGRAGAAGDSLERVRGLLAENTTRLRKYSGGERVGVMLDRARLHLAEAQIAGADGDGRECRRQLDAARALTDSANRRAFSGSVSYAGKLDVLAVQSEANRRFVEAVVEGRFEETEEVNEALELAGIAAHDLWRMAGELDARPARGLGAWLEAEALLVEHKLRKAEQGDDQGPTKRLLDRATVKVRDAMVTMEKIGDTTLNRRITKTRTSLHEAQAQE